MIKRPLENLLACILPVVVFLSGCAGSSMFNWQEAKIPTATAANPALRCLCLWQPGEGFDMDNKPCRGFAGQIFFFPQKGYAGVKVEGDVRIFVFDDEGTAEDQAKPFHQFDFVNGAWQKQLVDSQFGPAYQIFIPYTRKGYRQAECALRVRLKAKQGPTIYSGMVSLTLTGTATEKKDDAQFARIIKGPSKESRKAFARDSSTVGYSGSDGLPRRFERGKKTFDRSRAERLIQTTLQEIEEQKGASRNGVLKASHELEDSPDTDTRRTRGPIVKSFRSKARVTNFRESRTDRSRLDSQRARDEDQDAVESTRFNRLPNADRSASKSRSSRNVIEDYYEDRNENPRRSQSDHPLERRRFKLSRTADETSEEDADSRERQLWPRQRSTHDRSQANHLDSRSTEIIEFEPEQPRFDARDLQEVDSEFVQAAEEPRSRSREHRNSKPLDLRLPLHQTERDDRVPSAPRRFSLSKARDESSLDSSQPVRRTQSTIEIDWSPHESLETELPPNETQREETPRRFRSQESGHKQANRADSDSVTTMEEYLNSAPAANRSPKPTHSRSFDAHPLEKSRTTAPPRLHPLEKLEEPPQTPDAATDPFANSKWAPPVSRSEPKKEKHPLNQFE